MGDLTTLAIAQAWLGVASSLENDAKVGRLITALSSQIERWLGYSIASASYARAFNGRDTDALILPDRPVTAVASVKVDGVPIPAQSQPGTGYGYVFDTSAIYLVGASFTRGRQNVVVAYTAGYATTPPDIEQACLEWMTAAWEGADRDPTITSRKAGDTAEIYGGGLTRTHESGIIPMPASVWAVLQPYRRHAPV